MSGVGLAKLYVSRARGLLPCRGFVRMNQIPLFCLQKDRYIEAENLLPTDDDPSGGG